MSGALDAVATWPVRSAAVAVVGPSGVVASTGPVDQPFALASVTKPLAALTSLIAVEEEAIALDEPASTSLIDGVTVRHLFAHSSGLAFDNRVRVAVPGTRRVYSNAGIELLAEHVAAATGIAFEDYAREGLTRPLGLRSTTLGALPSRDGVSTVSDLALVMTELLSPTGLLHEPLLTQLRTVQFPGLRGVLPGFGVQDPNDWGLGFEIRSTKSPHWTGTSNSPATYGHFGQAGTMLWIDPVARLGLVVLTDQPFDDWARQAWPALSDAVLDAFG